MSSNVLEQTDHSHHAPERRTNFDLNNHYAKPDERRMIAERKGKESAKKNRDWNPSVGDNENTLIAKPVIDKHGFNGASLDTHTYAAQAPPAYECDYKQKTEANIPARTPHQQKKLAMLTSTIGGHDAIKQYDNKNKGEVIDFDLLNLPGNTDEMTVKKVANVKHIISTDLDIDNMKGLCTGNGRIKIRLNDGETED